jgi:hypothetical protein
MSDSAETEGEAKVSGRTQRRRMRKLRRVLAVLLVVTFAPAFGYSAEPHSTPAGKLKISPYPSEDEVNKSFFSSEGFRVSPLQTADINQEFSNIDDLSWLQPLVKECRVVLVGESHYNQYIHHLRNRLLFALNTFDRYPSVMLERPYSLTPFLNYYVALPDKEARDFEKADGELFLFTADLQFLQHVRRWNAAYPKKRIGVGCYDIEHFASLPIRQVLRPYFTRVKQALDVNGQEAHQKVPVALSAVARIFEHRDKYSSDDLKDAFQPIEDVLIVAKDENIVGRYPFLTADYVERVIENLESTFAAYTQDMQQHRQKAMIRNLTNSRFLGASFKSGNVLLHAGGSHTPTHVPHSMRDSFHREGSYLTYEFEPTKGKTFSLFLSGFAFSSLLDVEDLDIDAYGQLKETDYGRSVTKIQEEVARGALVPDAAYVIEYLEAPKAKSPAMVAFEQRLLHIAYQHDNRPLVIHHIPWARLSEQAARVSPEHAQDVVAIQEMCELHDLNILVPISPLTALRKRAEPPTADVRAPLEPP